MPLLFWKTFILELHEKKSINSYLSSNLGEVLMSNMYIYIFGPVR